MPNSGIYQIRNIINSKIYIGSAVDIKHRWVTHKSDLILGKHHSKHLQRAFNIYGINNFIFEIVEEVQDKNKLLEREQYWIDKTQSYIVNYGYNICKIAGSSLGLKRVKIWNKGLKGVCKPNSGSFKKGFTPWNKGKKTGASKKRNGVIVPCKICGKHVYKDAYRLKVYKNIYCSTKCQHRGLIKSK